MLRWYVVQTKPLFEDVAAEHLKRQNFEIFYPTYISPKIKPVIAKMQPANCDARPVFRGYLFVNFDIETSKWRSINGTKGVLKLLGQTENSVLPIKHGVIEQLMQDAAAGYFQNKLGLQRVQRFLEGEVLKIKDGPFKESIGICAFSAANRVNLILALLSGKVVVNIKADNVVRA